MQIISGYRGEPHITSQQIRNRNIGIWGFTSRIIEGVSAEMEATVVSANEVSISSGMVSCQGCTAEIPRGTSESVSIDNGTQGMLRRDLIVVRYTKNAGTSIENMSLVVIKGTPAASNPQTPSYTTGSIAGGDLLVDFPLYQVNLNGISIDSVTLLMNKANVLTWINTLSDSISAVRTRVSNIETKIGSSTMGTTATTVTGAIREIFDSIGTSAMGTTAVTVKGAIREIHNALTNIISRTGTLEGRVGSATLNTESVTLTYAVNELLAYINSLKTRATNLETRATALETHDNGQGVQAVTFSFGSLNFDSSGAIDSTKSFASVVPSGYTAIAAIPFSSGSYAAHFYRCGLQTTTTARIQLFRGEWESVTSTTPSIVLICVKNL